MECLDLDAGRVFEDLVLHLKLPNLLSHAGESWGHLFSLQPQLLLISLFGLPLSLGSLQLKGFTSEPSRRTPLSRHLNLL